MTRRASPQPNIIGLENDNQDSTDITTMMEDDLSHQGLPRGLERGLRNDQFRLVDFDITQITLTPLLAILLTRPDLFQLVTTLISAWDRYPISFNTVLNLGRVDNGVDDNDDDDRDDEFWNDWAQNQSDDDDFGFGDDDSNDDDDGELVDDGDGDDDDIIDEDPDQDDEENPPPPPSFQTPLQTLTTLQFIVFLDHPDHHTNYWKSSYPLVLEALIECYLDSIIKGTELQDHPTIIIDANPVIEKKVRG